jgi:hypothetical protein
LGVRLRRLAKKSKAAVEPGVVAWEAEAGGSLDLECLRSDTLSAKPRERNVCRDMAVKTMGSVSQLHEELSADPRL